MYAIYVDDKLLYSTEKHDEVGYLVINPKISYEVNKPSFFSFTLPPGNVQYNGIQKLKSKISVLQDGEVIFCGRAVSDESDTFNQKMVECESEFAYLKDSIQRPYEFDGTPMELLNLLITNHNNAVNKDQRFSIGTVTAISDSGTAQVDSNEYADTMSELNSRMINAYGGYFRVRHGEGVMYLDYLSDGATNTQPIEFGVNLLDLKKNISAEDVFNVLIPQGAMQKGDNGRYTESLKIKAVNGGLDYIEDAASIAKYGKRIWRTKQWENIGDANKLLAKGKEYLAAGISEETTLTIKAIDMRFADGESQRIGIGDKVRIYSDPHGLDKTDICTKIEFELLNPENSVYTFGKPKMTLTDNVVVVKKQYGGGGGSGKTLPEEVSDIRRWATIAVNEAIANINLSAGEINNLTGRMSAAEIDIDGLTANINLIAKVTDELSGRMSAAEIDINGLEGEINLRATKSELDAFGERVTTAEASITLNTEAITLKVSKDGVISAINQTAESVTISASKINLSGYVTASQLSATNASISNITSGLTTAMVLKAMLFSGDTVNVTSVKTSVLNHGDKLISRRSMEVSTPSGTQTIYYLGYIP